MLTARELAEKLISNFPPRPPGSGIAPVLCEPLAQQLPMPVRHADLCGRRGDSVPKCLNVLNLLLDWQLVEPGRRNR